MDTTPPGLGPDADISEPGRPTSQSAAPRDLPLNTESGAHAQPFPNLSAEGPSSQVNSEVEP